jgi:hypothetical protein
VVLAPLKMVIIPKPSKGEGCNLLFVGGVEKTLTECGKGYVLVVVEKKDPIEIPLMIQPLLEEFPNVIPKNFHRAFHL